MLYTLLMPIAKERILFEDQWLLAVSKLAGELVVQGKGRLDKLPLLDFLRKDHPGILAIHRLDFETSGVVVFAKSKSILGQILATKFAGWKKEYVAIALGQVKQGSGSITFKLPARSGEGKVAAETQYSVVEHIGPVTLLRLTIERGQKHQIRRHLSMIHHPLILDDVYGIAKANKEFGKFLKLHRFFLHASRITFPHPFTGTQTEIICPMPKTFEVVLKKLRNLVAGKGS